MLSHLDAPEVTEVSSREERKVFLPLCAIGAILGICAGIFQILLFRYGGLGRDQWFVYWGSFVVAGLLLSWIGGTIGWLASHGSSRRWSLLFGAVLSVLVFAVLLPLNVRPKPNVFLLITDATRADHLSLYGYERKTTPFLEELAGRSVVFDHMVSQGSHTIVSTPCILASCYPSEHGIVGYSNVLSDRFQLISEYLKDAGYHTYGYATNPHLGPKKGYAQGFDRYAHDPGWAQTPADLVNRRFLTWLDDSAEPPFFGFLFYIDTHNPYLSPPNFQRLFDPDWKGEPVSDWKQGPDNRPEPRTLQNLLAQYDGSIAYWDSQLKVLLSELGDRGFFENTLVIYTSDHGEEFWEHGNWGHDRTLFEESIHVPLLISFPVPFRFPPVPRTSRRLDQVVSSVDIVPTVLDYLRIDVDPNVRGRSVCSAALGREGGDRSRWAYCEEILQRYGPYDLRGLRTCDRKYIMTFDYEGARDLDDLFFDLEVDPKEEDNLLRERPEEAAEHRRTLAALVQEISRYAPARVDTVEIDEATREALRALGYLE